MATASFTRRDWITAALAALVAPGVAGGAGPAGPAGATGRKAGGTMTTDRDGTKATRMPVLFVGHGNPMNAIEDNRWTQAFRDLAKVLPRPRAILAVSAHWYVAGTFATGNAQPPTIHDFGGFPEPLYQVRYPAPGNPALARRAVELAGTGAGAVRDDWGLDHGTWTVLMHVWPDASIPIVQLSIDGRLPPAGHIALGRALAPLRDEGVLIVGSGNVTHNLRHAFGAWRSGATATPDWARTFDDTVTKALQGHDQAGLAGALETEAGRLAHPTPDHYLPLLYVAGAARKDDPVRFPTTGFDMGSLSMRAALLG